MLKIFLAHAKEDKKIVTDLYYRLKEKGYKPWLDKEELLPAIAQAEDFCHSTSRPQKVAHFRS